MSTTETPAPAAAAQDRPKALILDKNGIKYGSVLNLNTPEAVEQFKVQFTSFVNQVRQLQAIDQRIQVALTTAEKDALAKVREQEIRDVQGKDSLFQKVYGFSAVNAAQRPHDFLETVVQLMTPVTDEELTKFRENKEFKEEEVVVRNSSKLVKVSTIRLPAIQGFLRDYQIIQLNRQAAGNLKARLDSLPEGEEKTKTAEAFAEAEKKLNEDNATMAKTYGFSLNRNYVMEIQAGIFFVGLTKEEFERATQPAAAEAPKAEAKKEKAAKA